INLESSGERELKGPSSGISLGNPADSGISLEQGGEGSDEIEFELSLDAQATPKPASPADSSSEFELSLDSGEGPVLTPESPSDSEFELTLDDSGNLSSEETPQLKAGKDKDIFETDFEVPALEEESGSQVAALDTDLDSSDFDLALGDSDVAVEEDSGSEVVALDEEAADDAAATIAAPKRKTKHKPAADLAEDEDLGFDQLDEEAGAAGGGSGDRKGGPGGGQEKKQKNAPPGRLP